MIEVVVFILLLVCVISMVYSYKLRGGQFFSYIDINSSDDRNIITPSMIARDKLPHATIEAIIDEASKIIERISVIEYKKKRYVMSECQGKRLSDAYIDMEIFNQWFDIEDGFAISEISSSSINPEVEKDVLSVGAEPIVFVDHNNISTCWSRNFGHYLFRDHNVHSFIDFTYALRIDTAEAYRQIHQCTNKIAQKMKLFIDNGNQNVLMYKIYVAKDGKVNQNMTPQFILEHNKLRFVYTTNEELNFKNIQQRQIVVPDTARNGFQIDEFIEFKSGNNTHEIQIEDSENLTKHKSNNIEFMFRIFASLSDDPNYKLTELDVTIIQIAKEEDFKYHIMDFGWDNRVTTILKSKYSDLYSEELIYKLYHLNNIDLKVLAIIILQYIGYDVVIENNHPYLLFRYQSKNGDIEKSPIYNAWPDMISNYFKQVTK